MSDIVQTIPVGAQVELRGGIKATVLGILIRSGNRVLYDCGYWSGSSYQNGWFESFLVEPETVEKTKIGFVTGNIKQTEKTNGPFPRWPQLELDQCPARTLEQTLSLATRPRDIFDAADIAYEQQRMRDESWCPD